MYLLRNKSETALIKSFIVRVGNKLSTTIKTIRSNSTKKYMSQYIEEL